MIVEIGGIQYGLEVFDAHATVTADGVELPEFTLNYARRPTERQQQEYLESVARNRA